MGHWTGCPTSCLECFHSSMQCLQKSWPQLPAASKRGRVEGGVRARAREEGAPGARECGALGPHTRAPAAPESRVAQGVGAHKKTLVAQPHRNEAALQAPCARAVNAPGAGSSAPFLHTAEAPRPLAVTVGHKKRHTESLCGPPAAHTATCLRWDPAAGRSTRSRESAPCAVPPTGRFAWAALRPPPLKLPPKYPRFPQLQLEDSPAPSCARTPRSPPSLRVALGQWHWAAAFLMVSLAEKRTGTYWCGSREGTSFGFGCVVRGRSKGRASSKRPV